MLTAEPSFTAQLGNSVTLSFSIRFDRNASSLRCLVTTKTSY